MIVRARIDPEGHYVATGVKTGTVRFAVVSSGPSGAAPPSNRKAETKNGQEGGPGARAKSAAAVSTALPKSAPRRQPLPKQYADPQASGITTVVTRGDNVFDIDLK